MAHFTGTTAPLFTKAEFEGDATKPYIWTGQPTQVDFAEYISGSVFSDQAGVLLIQQCLDLPVRQVAIQPGDIQKWAEEGHWADAEEETKVEAKKGTGFFTRAIAPFFRLVFTNTAGTAQKELRIAARAFEPGKI